MQSSPFSPATYRVQKTLRSPVHLQGVGIHSGEICRLSLHSAPPNHGIVFERTDLPKRAKILAHYDAVVSTKLATSIGYTENPEIRIGTVEHLTAALFALGITNLNIEVSGPEIPILDGSAAPLVESCLAVGLEAQPYSVPTLKVLKAIKVYENDSICELLPREGLRVTTTVDFPHPLIGLQTFALDISPESFVDEISRARTFGFRKDLDRLQSMGLAFGASLENVLAFSESEILNKEGARFADECVRHKILDALGDLALCGCAIEGELLSYRGGHSIHLALLKALRENRSHWQLYPAESLEPAHTRHQPFVALRPQYIS